MRKSSILLLLAIVTLASTVGCSKTRTRCRNLFRRGVPCCGTARATPAVIGAPVAITAPPVATPAPMVQQVMPQPAPQYIVPQVMAPQIMAPQIPCCPPVMCQPCNPCQMPCDPCDPCGSGGYIQGGMITEGCQDCGPVTTYDQGAIETGTVVVDPAPLTNE